MKYTTVVLLVCCSFNSPQVTAAQTCEPSQKRHAQTISGEIAGKHKFIAAVTAKWLFMLESSEYGWDIRLRDQKGMHLSQITPPFHSVPNGRELYGWHFRNKANTGKNNGDVNAPQQLRLFEFSPSLSGTCGFRPPPPSTHVPQRTSPDNGRGALTIIDMRLVDLEPGHQAQMNYLKFQVCLTWPKSEQ